MMVFFVTATTKSDSCLVRTDVIILKNGRKNGNSASVTVNVPHWVTVALITFLGTFSLARYYISLEPVQNIHLIPRAWSEHGVEALWTGQKNILLSCPQCLDSMLAPGFWNKVYNVD